MITTILQASGYETSVIAYPVTQDDSVLLSVCEGENPRLTLKLNRLEAEQLVSDIQDALNWNKKGGAE